MMMLENAYEDYNFYILFDWSLWLVEILYVCAWYKYLVYLDTILKVNLSKNIVWRSSYVLGWREFINFLKGSIAWGRKLKIDILLPRSQTIWLEVPLFQVQFWFWSLSSSAHFLTNFQKFIWFNLRKFLNGIYSTYKMISKYSRVQRINDVFRIVDNV
jgi:hypothetical protein